MAQIVAAGALAHSPLINKPPPDKDAPQIAAYRGYAADLGRRIMAVRPDVVLIFGQDHFRTLFYDMMPAFLVGTGRIDAWGDWDTPNGPFTTAPELARHIHRSLLVEGFDPACSYDLKVDHGITQPLQLCDLPEALPIVPVLINTAAPPMPAPERCYAFGAAVGRAIASYSEASRVAVIGSGGLSHAPPNWDVESDDPADRETVERLIHGRAQVAKNAAAREANLVDNYQKFVHAISPEWDHAMLDRFARGDAAALAAELDAKAIEAGGGYGGQEIRTWLAMAGAAGNPAMEVLGYEPIEFLVTGMAAVAAELAA
jgi:2,3-dihydroxyphenylpropionate 1,2-dioxygenase